MGYKVIVGASVGVKDGVNQYQCEVYADTAEDIPATSKIPHVSAGSVCIVMDTKDALFLNTKGEWK